ncbi:MAG: serine hydrolase [Acidobacteria bacterium]|nr:MAG: serine hydrolase [Acidobacteriota bacterium]
MLSLRGYFGCLLAILALGVSLAAQPSADSALDARVRAEIAQFPGKVSLFAKNLDSGVNYGFGADDLVRTASTIKVPVMIEAFAKVAAGRVQWTDKVLLTDAKKISGSGVLQELSDGLQLGLRDAVTLMIVLSDNTATNLVLDVLTTDAVNARMEGLGLTQTRILRKVGGGGVSKAGENAANARFGLGVATPREMVLLLEKLERGDVVSREASTEMIKLLKRQQDHEGIGRTLKGVEMATKPGALDRLRSDVGILYTRRGRIAMAITCDEMPDVDWTVDNPGYLLLSRLSIILADGLSN